MASETSEAYFDKIAKMGGIVEEFIEAEEKHSPSAQLRIGPRGDVLLISTHDQILGGPSGQVFLGCRFPARDDYRLAIQEAGLRIGQVLSAHGVVSRFGVDFLVYRDSTGRGVEDDRARDQPAHGRHHAPLPGAAVPHGRQPRPGERPLPLAERPGQVLQGHRQPLLRRATAACCPRTWSTS